MGLTNVLRDLRAHVAALTSHGATNAKNANTTMARDASGRSKVTDPSAADDIATKGYTDGVMETERTARNNAINGLSGGAQQNQPAPDTDEIVAEVIDQIDSLYGDRLSEAATPAPSAGTYTPVSAQNGQPAQRPAGKGFRLRRASAPVPGNDPRAYRRAGNGSGR